MTDRCAVTDKLRMAVLIFFIFVAILTKFKMCDMLC